MEYISDILNNIYIRSHQDNKVLNLLAYVFTLSLANGS